MFIDLGLNSKYYLKTIYATHLIYSVNENDVRLSRREIILAIGGLSAIAAAGYSGRQILKNSALSSQQGSIIYGGKYPSEDRSMPFGYKDYSEYKENSLYRLDVLSNKIDESYSLTGAHSTEPHPKLQHIVCCVMKRSNRISLFDWDYKKEIASYVLPKDEYFNGHAAFSMGGSKILVSGLSYVEDKVRPKGLIYIFDFPSLTLENQIFMGEFKAHEMKSIGKDQFVCGLLGGDPGRINFGILDLHKLKLFVYFKETQKFKSHLAINHLALNGNIASGLGNIIENNVIKKGGLFRFDIASKEISIDFDIGSYNINTEMLSTWTDRETGYVWMTVPLQGLVLVWDMRKNDMVSIIKCATMPLSVVEASSIDSIIIGTSGGMKAYDRKTLENRNKLDEKWSALKLNSVSAAHTRII